MPDTLRTAVHQARTHIEEAVETREAPTLVEAKAIDAALTALDRLAETLDGAAFWSEHVQIIHVDIPAPLSVPRKAPAERALVELPEKKHTITGIGRIGALADPSAASEAYCSCGWAAVSSGQNYVGQGVAEHLVPGGGHPGVADVRKWSARADLPFTGRRP